MNRYVFQFSKTGYLRFISHLDLQRLLRRSIKRAGIRLAYTQGFNPHEMINLVEALSLGFETTGDYFEIVTLLPYEPDFLLGAFNAAFPEGLHFDSCRELPYGSKNLSTYCDSALYEAVLPLDRKQNLQLSSFLAQDSILISKVDKKTKKPVEKDVKSMVYSLEESERTDESIKLTMLLRCASNETLNPVKLLTSLWNFNSMEYPSEDARITRKELYARVDGKPVPLREYQQV